MSATTLKSDRRLTLMFWSVTLIGGGLWLLLINFNLLDRFEPTAQYILAGVLAILGIGFFGAFLRRREKWWRLIPGWLLITLAAMVLLSTRPVTPDLPPATAVVDGRLIAAVLFWGMAIAFLHVFLLRRKEYWWAIIPSGFMAVLGGIVAASLIITRLETLGALLCIGMGLVFVLLYAAARAEQGWWPLIPATVLILFGIAAFTAGSGIQNIFLSLWPILLILGGIYLARLAWSRHENTIPDHLEIHATGPHAADRAQASKTDATKAPAPPPTTRGKGLSFSRRGITRANANRTQQTTSSGKGESPASDKQDKDDELEGVLGAYAGPAPGTSVDLLDETDDDPRPRKDDSSRNSSANKETP